MDADKIREQCAADQAIVEEAEFLAQYVPETDGEIDEARKIFVSTRYSFDTFDEYDGYTVDLGERGSIKAVKLA